MKKIKTKTKEELKAELRAKYSLAIDWLEGLLPTFVGGKKEHLSARADETSWIRQAIELAKTAKKEIKRLFGLVLEVVDDIRVKVTFVPPKARA